MIGALACGYLGTFHGVPSWHIARSCPHRQKAATSMAGLAWLWRQTSINYVCSLSASASVSLLYVSIRLLGPNRTVP